MDKTSKDTELGSSFNDTYNARKIMLRNFPGVEFGKKMYVETYLEALLPYLYSKFLRVIQIENLG